MKKKYEVAGLHKVHGVEPGEVVQLNPKDPSTQRLLQRGQIKPVSHTKPVAPQPIASTDEEKDNGQAGPA